MTERRVLNLRGRRGVIPEGAVYIGDRLYRGPWRLLIIATCMLLCEAASNAFGQGRPTPITVWEFNSPADAPFCQINGKASEGDVVLFAGTENYFDKEAKVPRDVVLLMLRKPTWHIPAGTAITATMAFSDGTSVKLIGTGKETEADSTLQQRRSNHGFTVLPLERPGPSPLVPATNQSGDWNYRAQRQP